MSYIRLVLLVSVALCLISPFAMGEIVGGAGEARGVVDGDYYFGVGRGLSPALLDGPFGNGRLAFGPQSNWQGTQIAFVGINFALLGVAPALQIFVVDIGAETSWRAITPTATSPDVDHFDAFDSIGWSLDGNFIFVGDKRINVETGAGENIPHLEVDVGGVLRPVRDISTTNLAEGNLAVGVIQAADFPSPGVTTSQLLVTPIALDGSPTGPSLVVMSFTDSDTGTPGDVLLQPSLSQDGKEVLFTLFNASDDPFGTPPAPDSGSIHLLMDLRGILASGDGGGGIAADAILGDPRSDPAVLTLRGDEPSFSGNATSAFLGGDKLTVAYREDFANTFTSSNWGGTLATSNWNIMFTGLAVDPVTNLVTGTAPLGFTVLDAEDADGDLHLVNPFPPTVPQVGNTLFTGQTPEGSRLIGLTDTAPGIPFLVAFIITITSTETFDVAGDPDITDVSAPTGQTVVVATVVDGTPIDVTVGDNALQIDPLALESVTVADSAGTVVELPPGQVIDFPSGELQAISIETPTDPLVLEDVVLPIDAPEDTALPVLRDFGPDGTVFTPPIPVTITYTDGEILGLDESALTVYVRPTPADPFVEATVIARDPAKNTITFLMSEFSQAAAGGAPPPTVPVSTPFVGVILLLALLASGSWFIKKRMNTSA